MTSIYFVRHAHSVYSTDEYGRGLSERGKEDAGQVADRFKGEHIDVVFSSPYKRAIETVQGIADFKGLEVQTIENLKERKLAAHSVDYFDYAIQKVWAQPDYSFQGGESNIQAQKRAIPSISNLLRKYEGKGIVIGTHGNIMVLVMNHFDRKYNFDFWKRLTIPDIYKLTFEHERLVDVKRIRKGLDEGKGEGKINDFSEKDLPY
ncbi:histidine phosphatase family protein [Pseudalkalibacillus salsuginis]|uniref:histidine phosphatase family protein n=1 Tax=Pseudalkalibacillus salsuginis TaxID=2910972 RepID=UPI001F42F3BC|nr:histidine phosphatase family protein [Pseudalkalibacillus salsuginis]MCF6411190.1 histidine phosphatase family protein [Pseudalkalibacillus salsuginis]